MDRGVMKGAKSWGGRTRKAGEGKGKKSEGRERLGVGKADNGLQHPLLDSNSMYVR